MNEPSLLQSGAQLGAYQIVRLIGRGAMAEVYEATHTIGGKLRSVAIKVLIPKFGETGAQFVERFRREAGALIDLEHPHILPIYDLGSQDNLNYITMRYVSGGTLETLIQHWGSAHGQPDEQRVKRLLDTRFLLTRVADALDLAHQQGVIHRDLKPSNVLIDQRGNPYVSDFGIAKVLSAKPITISGAFLGTPQYMSPEQMDGLASPRSDIFALGVMIHEMLTGELPVRGHWPHEFYQLYRGKEFKLEMAMDLFGVPVTQALKKALRLYPDDRYETMMQFAEAFYQATDNLADDSQSPEDIAAAVLPNPPDYEIAPPPPRHTGEDRKRYAPPPPERPVRMVDFAPAPDQVRPLVQSPAPLDEKPSKRFSLPHDHTPMIPQLCPVCLATAREPIAVRYGLIYTQTIYFCSTHAQAYRQITVAYGIGMASFALLTIPLFLLLNWLGLILVAALFIAAQDLLNRLRGKQVHEARLAVRLHRQGSRVIWRTARSAYAKAIQQANQSVVKIE
jgi:serine/threonine protein kinase